MSPAQTRSSLKKIILPPIIGILLAAFPLVAERSLNYQPVIYTIIDLVWLPGSLVARVFYPAGIHTGGGSDAYVPLAFAFNVVIYWALTFGVVAAAKRARASAAGG